MSNTTYNTQDYITLLIIIKNIYMYGLLTNCEVKMAGY